MYDAVIFDLDGTLIDTESIAIAAWAAAGADCGITIPEGMCETMIGHRYEDLIRISKRFLPEGNDSVALLDRANVHYDRLTHEATPEIKPGAFELLDAIEALGLPKAVATSSQVANARHKLEITGLMDRFAFFLSGDQVEHGKPAPDLFLATATKLEVAPERCVVLEDSAAGIRGAHAAGMAVFWTPDRQVIDAETKKLIAGELESLDALIPFLRPAKG